MNIFVILSGGTGSRIGTEVPKQYIEVNGKPIIEYSIERFAELESLDYFAIVANERWHQTILKVMEKYDGTIEKFLGFSSPGGNRQLSILNVLEDIEKRLHPEDGSIVIIHDAARPKVKSELIDECITAAFNHDGAMPVLPMNDTVYLSEDGKTITGTLKRESVVAGQAPEAFKFKKYLEANRTLLPTDILSIKGSSEPAIMAGMDIAIIKGDSDNYKITTQSDLDRFINESILFTRNI